MSKKISQKIISIAMSIVIMIGISGLIGIYAENVKKSNLETKPKINLNYLGAIPENPMQGQDFTVRYELVPEPFKHNITNTKEIVLVLDKSGSMDEQNKMNNLKKAAKNFINSMTATDTDGTTPKITNLKIGIISYNRYGEKETDLLEVTSSSSVNNDNKNKLISKINELYAYGGTNTGDGLRKGAHMLGEGDINSNKTIILMSDGIPTYYSHDKGKYYKTLSYDNKSSMWTNNSDTSGRSLKYATEIGDIIKNKNYNVFSIGYGLGASTSDSNKKLKTIHESMGGVSQGENSTFFATDSQAIDSVFNKISDKLEKSYSFNDALLNLNLSTGITVVEGFESTDSQGNIIKINPIVYQLSENNWYRAEKQIIEFKVNSNLSGSIPLFTETGKLTYTDINGIQREIQVENPIINIKPFEAGDNEKLQVDFTDLLNGYLIGDNLSARVTFVHPDKTNVKFNNANFILNELPDNIVYTNGSGPVLNFGTLNSTKYEDYTFKINDDDKVSAQREKTYKLSGNYKYSISSSGNQILGTEIGTKEKEIKVKRGQIKVKVLDSSGKDITSASTVAIKTNSTEVEGVYSESSILFDTVSSGNYELLIKSLPSGCQIPEGEGNAIVNVSFDNNIVTYTFNVNGKQDDNKITIDVNDSSGKIEDIYDSSVSSESRYDKIIKTIYNKEYKLFGDSYANIKFEGKDINYLQYRFISEDDYTEGMNLDNLNNWQDIIDEEGNVVNDDIMLDAKGNLNNQSYDVSHMPAASGGNQAQANLKWKDESETFKKPYSGTEIKPAVVKGKGGNDPYIKEEIDPDTSEKKQVGTSIFIRNDNYGNSYREARKNWGYIKIPEGESGYYKFGIDSDDGCRLYLTVNGKEKKLIDAFYLKGSSLIQSKESVYLEGGKFYPIYTEYFNWGGGARFELFYTKVKDSNGNNISSAKKANVPQDWFYPSKSKSPVESSGNRFNGEAGIKFPEETGAYYVAYKAGKKDNQDAATFTKLKEGIYGPFIVENRFDLQRKIDFNESNGTYQLIYNITPRAISVTDVYKNQSQLTKENLEKNRILNLKNIKLSEQFPQEVEFEGIVENGQSYNPSEPKLDNQGKLQLSFKNNIKYTLKIDENNLANSVYEADAITLKLKINPINSGKLTFEENSGVLIYEDITLNSNERGHHRQQYFGQASAEVVEVGKIIKHGMYKSSKDIEEGMFNVVPKMNYNIAVTIESGRNNSVFRLEKNNNKNELKVYNSKINIDANNIYIYECDDNYNIKTSTRQKANVNSLADELYIDISKKGKYAILYNATFTEFSPEYILNIGASLGKDTKRIEFNMVDTSLPDLF